MENEKLEFIHVNDCMFRKVIITFNQKPLTEMLTCDSRSSFSHVKHVYFPFWYNYLHFLQWRFFASLHLIIKRMRFNNTIVSLYTVFTFVIDAKARDAIYTDNIMILKKFSSCTLDIQCYNTWYNAIQYNAI